MGGLGVVISIMASKARDVVLLLLCVTGGLLLWHHVVMEPSCDGAPPDASAFKVIVVADLHLAGPGTAWLDRVRRETFMQSVFQRAYRGLRPDALVVLGDVSDAGRRSTDAQWSAVVARFWELVRPFAALPVHVVVGNHDVGDYHDPGFASRLPRFAASFPGFDSRFTWGGVDFVSLNAMAIHAHGCSACAESDAASVLLLHLPLYRADENACAPPIDLPRCAPWHDLEGPCSKVGSSPPSVPPQELLHRVGQDVMSAESSTELLHSFRPRLVLNGHTHRWCERAHANGTREVTVPSLSWRNRDDPSFVLLAFRTNSSHSITVHRFMLAHESTILFLYILWGCTLASWLIAASCILAPRLTSKSVKPE